MLDRSTNAGRNAVVSTKPKARSDEQACTLENPIVVRNRARYGSTDLRRSGSFSLERR